MFLILWDGLAINAAVLGLAYALDRVLPESPAALHPVVWMGRATGLLARASPRGPLAAFLYGSFIVVVITGASAGGYYLVGVILHGIAPWAYIIGGSILLRTLFTVRGLSSAAHVTRHALEEERLGDARASLKSLVSRDAASLSEAEAAGAAIESVAENSTDSFIGPWMAFALLGLPGAAAYRAVNTLDSMIGYRGHYEYIGKAAARLDDIVNWVPARLSALLLLVTGGLTGFSVKRGWRIMLRDQGRTASPNAGWTMSAMSGLLGTRLEKAGEYVLGEGFPEPTPTDIRNSIRIIEWTAGLGLVAAEAVGLWRLGLALVGWVS